jgi:ribosome-binding factor A
MPHGARTDRVQEEFREVLAEEIQRLKDPRIGFVTVTAVRVTPDLRHARVFFTSFGDERQKKASAAGLRSARAYLRSALGAQVRLKFLPDLEFEEDTSVAAGVRIDQIIDELRREKEDP